MRLGRITRRRGGILLLGLVAVGVGGAVLVWTSRDPWPKRVVVQVPVPSLPVGFTPDGRAFVMMNRDGPVAWDLATGKPRRLATLGLRRTSRASDRRSIVGVTGDDRFRSVVVWADLASGAILAQYPLQGVQALSPTIIDEGRSIRAVVVDRGRVAEIATWDVASGVEVRRSINGPRGQGSWMASELGPRLINWVPSEIAPDGRVWAYWQLGPNGFLLWDSETDRPISGLLAAPPEGVGTAAFGPDGRTLVIGGGTSQFNVWDLTGPRLLRTIQVDARGLLLGEMEVSPDGRTLASTWGKSAASRVTVFDRIRRGVSGLIPGWRWRADNELILIDLTTGQTLARSPGSVGFQFTPDGRTIATHEPDGTFAVRDVPQSSGR